MWGPVSPSRGSCKQPRSSCVPAPTYHHQRPESHEHSPSYSRYKDAYLESLLKTVSTRGCIFTLDEFKMGWDKLLGIGFSTALKIVQRSSSPTAEKNHFRSSAPTASTVDKSQTNATNATLPPLEQI